MLVSITHPRAYKLNKQSEKMLGSYITLFPQNCLFEMVHNHWSFKIKVFEENFSLQHSFFLCDDSAHATPRQLTVYVISSSQSSGSDMQWNETATLPCVMPRFGDGEVAALRRKTSLQLLLLDCLLHLWERLNSRSSLEIVFSSDCANIKTTRFQYKINVG